MSESLQKKIDKLALHYDELGKQFGYSPSATQQSSIETQEKRLQVLLEMSSYSNQAKILDFGCGTGNLFALLKQRDFQGEYIGYDISVELLEIAKKQHPDARFELKNVLETSIEESFDWVFISGVFNNDIEQNQIFMHQILTILFAKVKKGLVFNALSHYVDYQSPGLFYYDPCQVFDFCKKNLTTHVVLNHAYHIKPDVIPFEFSCCLQKSEFSPVSPL